METTLALTNITDLVCALHLGDRHFDMITIERCMAIEMQETNLRWRPYFVVLAENIDGYKQSPHETVEEYFFDAINAVNMTEGKIALLVKLCIA